MFTRVTACRLAESPCGPSVSKAPTVSLPQRAASIAATGSSAPDAGWELHPPKTDTFYTAHTRSDPCGENFLSPLASVSVWLRSRW
jgi:hypothetical protein